MALYGCMTERKTFVICRQDICMDTLKCARPIVNIMGFMSICMYLCNCFVYCSDNHIVLHIHVHRPDAPAQQNGYDWTSP